MGAPVAGDRAGAADGLRTMRALRRRRIRRFEAGSGRMPWMRSCPRNCAFISSAKSRRTSKRDDPGRGTARGSRHHRQHLRRSRSVAGRTIGRAAASGRTGSRGSGCVSCARHRASRQRRVVALGIGTTTAIFSVVYGVMLRPLPYDEPERLVALWSRVPERLSACANAADQRVLVASNTVFDDIALARLRRTST